MTDTQTPHVDENHLIAERRGKLAAIREKGVAFPNDFVPKDRAAKLHTAFGELEQAPLAEAAIPASVAGRMMLKRVMGKASFATLQDSTGRIQIYLDRNSLGEENYDSFKQWDIVDSCFAKGVAFHRKQ